MRERLLLRNVLGGLLLTLCLASNVRAEAYPVKVDRVVKVGDEYGVDGSGSSSNDLTITPDGGTAEQKQQGYKAELQGVIKVTEVNAEGAATKIECTVDNFKRDDKSLLDKGTVVTEVIENGKQAFAVKGQAVEAPAAEALAMFLTLRKPGESGETAIFGNKDPQAVGATWPINAEAAAKDLAAQGDVKINKDDIKGTVKLASVEKINGKDYLHLEATVTADNVSQDAPQGKITNGQIQAALKFVVAADGSGGRASESQGLAIKLTVVAQTPDGKNVTVLVNNKTDTQTKYLEAK